MKKIWNCIADIRLTFWLLLAMAITMGIGSYHALYNFSLFMTLDTAQIHKWLLSDGIANPGATWWMPVLFLIIGLLVLNTFACTVERLKLLINRARENGKKVRPVHFAPSVVHLFFILILFGHLLSSAFSYHQRQEIHPGSKVILPGGTVLSVEDVKIHYFPDNSKLANRISQCTVQLADTADPGRQWTVRFLEPAVIDGIELHLDMEKKRHGIMADKKQKTEPAKEDEVCDQSPVYHVKKLNTRNVYLVMRKDAGFHLLVPSFFVVIIMMGWYYTSRRSSLFA
jgi:hypothetical protein